MIECHSHAHECIISKQYTRLQTGAQFESCKSERNREGKEACGLASLPCLRVGEHRLDSPRNDGDADRVPNVGRDGPDDVLGCLADGTDVAKHAEALTRHKNQGEEEKEVQLVVLKELE